MRVRGVLALAVLTAVIVVLVLRRTPAAPDPNHSPKPWSLNATAGGITLTWDRTTPELRNAAQVDLILHEDTRTTTHPLDRRTGTLVIPYTPRAAILNVDGKRYPVWGTEPAPAPPPLPKPAEPRVSRPTLRLPMVLSNRGQRVVSTAAVVLPRVPGYVQRSFDIDLSIKVSPQGTVAGVVSDYRHDPLRNKLSAVASDAIAHWQFDRIAVNSYREGRIRLIFSPRGVSVRPSPVG